MRIAVLTYESQQANRITHHLLQAYPGQVAGIMRSEAVIAGKNLWQSLWFLLRQTGWGFVGPKGLEIILSRLMALLGKQPVIPSLKKMGQAFDVSVVGFHKINTIAARKVLNDWQADLIVSIYFNQLIGRKIIAMPARGVINIHPALLPKNRGLFPYFWTLKNGDAETGVTVHWVEPEFDTGAIIAQSRFPIQAQDTVISLARKSSEVGADLLVQAVRQIEQGQVPYLAQDEGQASYYAWPTSADVRHFKQQGRRYGSLYDMWKDLTE